MRRSAKASDGSAATRSREHAAEPGVVFQVQRTPEAAATMCIFDLPQVRFEAGTRGVGPGIR